MSERPQVVIIGAGLAGLSCAWNLQQAGVSFQIVEAASSVGGRVQTDEVGGFLLDRGFQVLLTAYPEARRELEYSELALKKFYPGAMVRLGKSFHRLADPFRRPIDAAANIFSPIGTLSDKLRIAKLRHRVLAGEPDGLFKRPEKTTLEALRSEGFSESIIETFFRPFLGGVFLDPELNTSSRLFEFLFRMFSVGDTALPARGMGAIPEQIFARLPPDAARLNTVVKRVLTNTVILDSGEQLTADAVVIATDGYTAAQLLERPAPRSHGVACVYFGADRPPFDEPLLVLSGNGDGPVNNLCLPSLVSASYAPAGAALISATVLRPERYDSARIETIVREQLSSWFGSTVGGWEHLRTYWIKRALPEQRSLPRTEGERFGYVAKGLYVCGDHTETASINGALKSGRLVAQAIAGDFQSPSSEHSGKNFGQSHPPQVSYAIGKEL